MLASPIIPLGSQHIKLDEAHLRRPSRAAFSEDVTLIGRIADFAFAELATGEGLGASALGGRLLSILCWRQNKNLLEWSLPSSSSEDTEHAASKPEPSTEDQIIMCSPAELTTWQ